MQLRYVVITSVDRDDLDDGGAGHYAACVREIKRQNPSTAVEALTPDFNGNARHVEVVVGSGLDVFAQNVETVKRLTHRVRDPRAGYEQTLDVLRHAKQHRPDVLTKGSNTARVFGRELVEQYGGRVVLIPVTEDISTSRIIEHIKNSDDTP